MKLLKMIACIALCCTLIACEGGRPACENSASGCLTPSQLTDIAAFLGVDESATQRCLECSLGGEGCQVPNVCTFPQCMINAANGDHPICCHGCHYTEDECDDT